MTKEELRLKIWKETDVFHKVMVFLLFVMFLHASINYQVLEALAWSVSMVLELSVIILSYGLKLQQELIEELE